MGNLTNNATNGNAAALTNLNADNTTVLKKADLTALKGGKTRDFIGSDDLIGI